MQNLGEGKGRKLIPLIAKRPPVRCRSHCDTRAAALPSRHGGCPLPPGNFPRGRCPPAQRGPARGPGAPPPPPRLRAAGPGAASADSVSPPPATPSGRAPEEQRGAGGPSPALPPRSIAPNRRQTPSPQAGPVPRGCPSGPARSPAPAAPQAGLPFPAAPPSRAVMLNHHRRTFRRFSARTAACPPAGRRVRRSPGRRGRAPRRSLTVTCRGGGAGGPRALRSSRAGRGAAEPGRAGRSVQRLTGGAAGLSPSAAPEPAPAEPGTSGRRSGRLRRGTGKKPFPARGHRRQPARRGGEDGPSHTGTCEESARGEAGGDRGAR